jgi:Tol biopolymer transport system component/tRNA A-37 threonylcarbamoyl transferase component Bud32
MHSGDQILHYRLVESIGEGGMGVVWKAADTSLGREVAVKLLPASFAEDAERVARFEQEARLLASLNHPSIAAIYGLHTVEAPEGQAGSTRFLAMELVSGEDLGARISRGRIAFDDVVAIARQVCDAIAAAHAAGVVHRDLKPANVMLTPDGKVKVLDFGLAKLVEGPDTSSGASASLSPTLTSAGTRAGMILGTAAYMSPEQARGRPVDKRADVWAFGCVLFEMLAGTRAFGGETVTDILAAVIRAEPDWNKLPPDTPRAIRRLLRRCLSKDPERRLHDVADARLELQDALDADEQETTDPAATPRTAPRAPGRREIVAWTLVVGAVLLAAWSLVFNRGGTPERSDPVRFSFNPTGLVYGLSEETALVRDSYAIAAVSPDGSSIAFIARAAGEARVWVRSFDAIEPLSLTGTEGADQLFWSNDGTHIAFRTADGLFAVPAEGGPVRRIGPAEHSSNGGSWSARGDVLIGTTHGVLRVDAAGGALKPVADAEEFGFWPEFLPDGDRFFYVSEIEPGVGRGADNLGIHVRSLSDPAFRRLILPVPSRAIFADGYLLYVSESALMARPFDPETLAFAGDPVVVANGLDYFRSHGGATFTVGGDRLVYVQPLPPRRHRWISRDGADEGPLGEPGAYARNTTISPDGNRAIGSMRSPRAGTMDLVLFDLERGTSRRATTEDTWESEPCWSPDGTRVAYAADPNGPPDIYVMELATGVSEKLYASPAVMETVGWAPLDEVQFMQVGSDRVLSLDPSPGSTDGEPTLVLALPGTREIAISPDRRFIAYTAVEGERPEIYVRPFGRAGEPVRLSEEGGENPHWRADGRELYFQSGADVLAVTVADSNSFDGSRPQRLFTIESSYAFLDATPDGQRFLVLVDAEGGDAKPIHVMLDWRGFLSER